MAGIFESLGRADIGGQAIRLGEAVRGIRAGRTAEEQAQVGIEATKVSTDRARNLAAEEQRQITRGNRQILLGTIRGAAEAGSGFSPKIFDALVAKGKARGMIQGEGEAASIRAADFDTFYQEEINDPDKALGYAQIGQQDFTEQVDAAMAELNTYTSESNKSTADLAKDKTYLALKDRVAQAQGGLTQFKNSISALTGEVEQRRKIELEEVKGAERIKAVKARAVAGGKGPAKAQMVKFLVDQGIAKDAKEAFTMASRLGTMTKEQFLATTAQNLSKPGSFGDLRDPKEIRQAMIEAENIYDQFVVQPLGTEGAGLTGDVLGNMITVSGVEYPFDPVEGTVTIDGQVFDVEGYNPLGLGR